MKLPPEDACKQGVSVTNDSFWQAVQFIDVLEHYLCDLGHPISLHSRHEVRHGH